MLDRHHYFRAALDVCATRISDEMKVAAAHAISSFIRRPRTDRLLPQILDRKVVRAVAASVSRAAVESGCARTI